MLTREELEEIEVEFSRYPNKQAVGVEALKIVQKHRGWVSDESLEAVAELLAMSPDALDGVATFYSHIYRSPVGRHVIRICNSVSCWIMGFDSLAEHLMKRLQIGFGETTADSRFTLLPNVCLGCCDHAPAMMVDDDLHRDLNPEKIDAILERYA